MTRVNLIDPALLTDQHLFAEYREITRLFALVGNALDKHQADDVIQKIPSDYRLGTGHVLFFYDKLGFIEHRYFALRDEVVARGFKVTLKDDITKFRKIIPERFYQNYAPNKAELALSIGRLIDKIHAKPNWYRMCGVLIDDKDYCQTLQALLQGRG